MEIELAQVHRVMPSEHDATGLPAVDIGWEPWRFVLSSFAVDTLIWGSAFSWGTWQSWYTNHSPFSTSSPVTLSAIGTTQLALLYAEMICGIILCRRFPHLVRRGVWGSLTVYVAALVVASFAKNVATLIIFQGVVAGAAGGFVYTPIYAYLSEWFVERRALAGGCIFAGAGVGGFIFPLIINSLLSRVGFRWALRIFAMFSLIVCSVAIPGLKPRIPVQKPVQGSSQNTPIKWELLSDPSLLILTLTIFAQGFLYSPIITYLPSYLDSFTSPFDAGFVLSVLNAASVPGQILTGFLCDRIPYPTVMLASALACLIVIFTLLRVVDTVAKAFGFSLLIGLCGGGFTSTWFHGATDIAGKDSLQAGPIFGYLAVLRGLSAIVGPIVAGKLFPGGSPHTRGSTQWGKFGLGSFVVFIGAAAGVTAVCAGVLGWWRMRARGRGSGSGTSQ